MAAHQGIEVFGSKTICKQPGRYIGWPTIGRLPDGELLAVFSGDRDAHVDPFGKTFLIRSSDNGATWGEPELINDTPMDDRDAGICVCRDGAVVVSWFTSQYEKDVSMNRCPAGEEDRWRQKLDSITIGDIRRWAGENVYNGRYELGRWIRRSRDGGRTWDDPVRVPPTTPHGPIELADGRLLFVGIGASQGRSERRGHLLAAASEDQGDSWSVVSRVNMYPEYRGPADDGVGYFCEPHVVEVEPGTLLAMARYEELPRRPDASVLWQFRSTDGGAVWTEPEPTPILGKPPQLTRLTDGRILVTYGHRFAPYGQRACLSKDGGKTWDYENEIILRDDAPSGDLGYPASVQLDDGSILTVYYQQEAAGEKTCLMQTHWQLRD